MYTPRHNRIDDRAIQLDFMRAHSFATLVTQGEKGLSATHLPIIVEEHGGSVRLLAHLAKANPQWHDFASGADALAIFAEPHAYISPRHYERLESVPTWNYAAVHAYGVPRVVADRDEKYVMQQKLIALHDQDYLARFPSLPPDYIEKMLAGIVSFVIDVTRLDARFKLSQDKLPVERARVIASLEDSGDTAALETARLMRHHNPSADE
jgi:transcriptional regulator